LERLVPISRIGRLVRDKISIGMMVIHPIMVVRVRRKMELIVRKRI